MNEPTTNNLLLLLGRIFFSLIFIMAGLQKIMNFAGTVSHMHSAGIPYSELLAIFAIIFELGGALMIFLGWYARMGALLIAIFTLAVTFVIHDFWTYPPAEVQTQMQSFMKNLSILGGALYIMAVGAGAYSLDYFRKRNREPAD